MNRVPPTPGARTLLGKLTLRICWTRETLIFLKKESRERWQPKKSQEWKILKRSFIFFFDPSSNTFLVRTSIIWVTYRKISRQPLDLRLIKICILSCLIRTYILVFFYLEHDTLSNYNGTDSESEKLWDLFVRKKDWLIILWTIYLESISFMYIKIIHKIKLIKLYTKLINNMYIY